MKRALFQGSFLFFAATNFALAEQFLCSPDAVGGVAFKPGQNQWVGTNFKTGPDLIISHPSADHFAYGHAEIIVTALGSNAPHIWCESGFSTKGVLHCDVGFYTFKFNKSTLRFIEIYKVGFISGEDNNDNTPAISIGKCAAF